MLWGGLRPIPSRTAVDVLTVAALFHCAAASPVDSANGAVLALACATTLVTAGPTARWPISFPLLPFAALQLLRRTGGCDDGWAGALIGCLSHFLAFASAALCVLFPALDLSPPPDAKHNVGVADLHLPVDFAEGVRRGSLLGTQHRDDGRHGPSQSYVSARVFYPTEDAPGRGVPYLDPESADVLCAELMKVGAPGPMKRFRWMLHAWKFVRIPARRNAAPLRNGTGRGMPVVIYSHGLTGASAIYTYQAMNLAAQGWLVLMVDHTDASAIAVKRRDSSHLLYDPSLVTALMADKDNDAYERRRRAQTAHRVEECLAALKALTASNRRNIPELESRGLSFVGLLDLSDVVAMGHSFGAATALAAASARPDLFAAVVAHEPAVDWMPDAARLSLLAPSEGTASGEEKKEGPRTLRDLDLLVLYSEEWEGRGWGNCKEIKRMHERGALGRPGGASDVGVISRAKHGEFSDTPVLTPRWLTRATGFAGERNPRDTADEVAVRTAAFLRAAAGR